MITVQEHPLSADAVLALITLPGPMQPATPILCSDPLQPLVQLAASPLCLVELSHGAAGLSVRLTTQGEALSRWLNRPR